jgi:PAT family beta-lactamase induction signal transducer AmpG
MMVVLMLGFSSGLPLALTGAAMGLWMKHEGYTIKKIGLFALVGLPYALKFLWSPLMDRYVPPFLGRRRGWIALAQLALSGVIVGLAATGVSGGIELAAVLFTLIAFCSATQDIAIDAYRTDLLTPIETASGATMAVMGARVGFICSGSLSMVLSEWLSWPGVYVLMAVCMVIAVAFTLFAPEPKIPQVPHRTFDEVVVRPFRNFLSRLGAWEILLFILVYKLDWAMVSWASPLFVQQTGFTNAENGAANGLGLFVTIAGAAAGGSILALVGMRRALLVLGLVQGLAGASYAWLAHVGHSYTYLATAVCVENFCSGMATAALTGFLMTCCDKHFTITQYALFSSVFALTRILTPVPSGWVSDQVGWVQFFLLSIAMALPGLLLLLRFNKWQMPQVNQMEPEESKVT